MLPKALELVEVTLSCFISRRELRVKRGDAGGDPVSLGLLGGEVEGELRVIGTDMDDFNGNGGGGDAVIPARRGMMVPPST